MSFLQRDTTTAVAAAVTTNRRVRIVLSHIGPKDSAGPVSVSSQVTTEGTSATNTAATADMGRSHVADQEECEDLSFSAAMLRRYLQSHVSKVHSALRHRIFELKRSQPDLWRAKTSLMSMDEQRKIALERAVAIAEQEWFDVESQVRDPETMHTIYEAVSLLDACAMGKIGIHYGLFGASVLLLGTAPHHEQFFKMINAMGKPLVGCFAMTELCHGSNVQGVETLAIYQPSTDEFEILTPSESAQKYWIGNSALHAQWAVVFAQLIVRGENHGVHAFLVQLRSMEDHSTMPGIRIKDVGHKIGMDGLDNGRIWFDHVRIPRSQLLNRYGDVNSAGEYVSPIKSKGARFFSHVVALLGGRIGTSITCVSGMKAVMNIGLKYAMSRRQFGAPGTREEIPVIMYLSQQRRLLPSLAMTFAMDFSVQFVRHQVTLLYSDPDAMIHGGSAKHATETRMDNQDLHAIAGALKAKISKTLVDCCQTVRECCGGQGMLSANRIGDFREMADASCSYEGDNIVLLQLAAKNLLGSLQKQFKEQGTMVSTLQYLTKRLKHGLIEMNPVTVRISSVSHLESEVFQLRALQFREWKLLHMLARRLQRKTTMEHLSSHQAWIESLDYAIDLGHAYVEHFMLKQFCNAIAKCPHNGLKPVLNKLRSLFALQIILRDSFFVSYIATNKSIAINDTINSICKQLLPHIKPLLDSFDIPDHVIDSPLTGDWIAYNKFSNDELR